jgi:hypothetical protein
MRHLGAGLAITTFPVAAPNGSWLPAAHNHFTDINFTHTRIGALLVTVLIAILQGAHRFAVPLAATSPSAGKYRRRSPFPPAHHGRDCRTHQPAPRDSHHFARRQWRRALRHRGLACRPPWTKIGRIDNAERIDPHHLAAATT